MDIYSYINRHNLLHAPKYVKYEKDFHIFMDFIHEKYGINFIEIYSTRMFMKRVKLNDETYFILDYHFWNLFEHYLTAYYFCAGRFPFGCNMDFVHYMIYNLIILTQASLQDDIPPLALSFAQEYERLGAPFKKYDMLVTAESSVSMIDEVIYFSLMAAILHEMGHERLNELSPSDNGYRGLMALLKKITLIEPDDKTMREAVKRTKIVLNSRELTGSEEVYCDYFSAMETIDIVEKVYGSQKSPKEKARLIYEVLTLPFLFQAVLVQNQMHWKYLYYQAKGMDKDCHKTDTQIKQYFNELTSRGSFLNFLYQLEICRKYGIAPETLKREPIPDFDEISQLLLDKHDYFFKKSFENEKKYSAFEARQLRNKILHWT